MEPFDIQSSNLHFWGENKNFFSQMTSNRGRNPNLKKWKNEKRPHFFFEVGGRFFLSPCYHARYLQQIHWFKIFCRMYGLVVMLTILTMSLINKILPLSWYQDQIYQRDWAVTQWLNLEKPFILLVAILLTQPIGRKYKSLHVSLVSAAGQHLPSN